MNDNLKHKLKSLLIFLSSGIYFFMAYIGFKNQNIDLSTLSQHNGVVEKVGLTYKKGSKFRKILVFFVDLNGLDQRLGIFRKDKDYLDLFQNISQGDEIKVYYKLQKYTNDVNIDLVQIEKNACIIYSKNEYEKKEGAMIWIGLFFGIISILISWLYFNKRMIGMKPIKKHITV